MASNITLNSGSGGSNLYTKQVTHDGDSVHIQGVTLAGISGTEDSYTAVDVAAGNGTAATALRVTIASDSTGVLSVDDNSSSLTVDNGGTFAVQVDGSALTALQLIDNIVLAEDTAHQSGDSGVMLLAVRQDTQSDFGADGDYVPLSINADGELRVTTASASGGTAETDDGAFTAGTDSGTPAMGFFSTDTVDSGDVGVLAMDASRRLFVSLEVDNAGLALESGGNLATLAGAVSGSEMQVDVVAALPTGSNTIGDVTVSGAALTALQLIDNSIFVDDAAFTEDSSSVSVAGAVRDDEVGSTDVVSADGDAGPLRMNQFGMLKTTQIWDATSEPKRAAIDAASSGDNTIVAAAGEGVKIRVLSLFLVAGGDVDVRFESGAGGTALTGQMDMTTNSGIVLPYNPAGWFETADNTLLNIELSAAVTVDGAIQYVEV